MAFVDTTKLNVVERLPGWHGRYFRSQNMTFAHYEFVSGASQIVRPGIVAIMPGDVCHSVKARTDGRASIVDYTLRRGFA
jgi:unsaturated pyranuronate lyase